MATDPLRARAKANRRRAVSLVAVSSVPLGLVVGLLVWFYVGWAEGLGAFVAASIVLALAMWWAAEPLARRATGGQPADPAVRSHARLLNLVEGLCATVGVRRPEVRVRPAEGLNAAVCGRRRRTATLVATQGLLDELDRVELEGVVAQLLTRVRANDMVPATVTVATLGIGATLLSPPEPVTAMDRAAMSFTRYPPGLISALEKMEAKGTTVKGVSRAAAHLWFADPGTRPSQTSLADRIAALREL